MLVVIESMKQDLDLMIPDATKFDKGSASDASGARLRKDFMSLSKKCHEARGKIQTIRRQRQKNK